MKRTCMITVIGLCLAVLMAAGSVEAKFPTKPIVLVAPGTVGGGSDIQARLIQAAVDRNFKLKEPVVILNKGKGEAYTYVAGKKGDGHYLLCTANQFLTYPMTAKSYSVDEFTPVANLVFDPGTLVARPDSKFKSLADIIKAAKAKPDSITIGGGRIGTQDHMAALTLMKATGIKLRFVPFPGGAALHRNVLGGQIDLAIGNPGDFISSLEAKKLVGLAMTTPERSITPSIAYVPTLKELGYDATFVTWRGYVGPAGMSKESIDFLNKLFKTVMSDKKFIEDYVKRMAVSPAYMDHAAFSKFMKEQTKVYEGFLRESGVIK